MNRIDKQLCDSFIHWNFSMTFEFDRQTIKDTSRSDCYDVDDETEKAGARWLSDLDEMQCGNDFLHGILKIIKK